MPLLVDAITALHYQHLTLEGKMTAWHCTFTTISVILLPVAGRISIFPMEITPPILLSGECNCITCHRRILLPFSLFYNNPWPDTDKDLMRGAKRATISSQISTPIPGSGLRKYSEFAIAIWKEQWGFSNFYRDVVMVIVIVCWSSWFSCTNSHNIFKKISPQLNSLPQNY